MPVRCGLLIQAHNQKFINPLRTNLCFSNAAALCLLNIPKFSDYVQEHTPEQDGKHIIMSELSYQSKLSPYCSSSTIRE